MYIHIIILMYTYIYMCVCVYIERGGVVLGRCVSETLRSASQTFLVILSEHDVMMRILGPRFMLLRVFLCCCAG
jgi:hypothetical protein